MTMTTTVASSPMERATPEDSAPPGPAPSARAAADALFPVVGIAASIGGEDACAALLRGLPEGAPLSIVLIHSGEVAGGSALSERLSNTCTLPFRQLSPGMKLAPGHVHVVPAGMLATLSAGEIQIVRRPRGEAGRLPADVFLRSLARELKSNAIGVVLSGAGNDGALGLQDIKAEGGLTFAQTPHTAERADMPRHAISGGGVYRVLGPAEIGVELSRLARARAATPSSEGRGPRLDAEEELARVVQRLRAATGVDFSGYKKSTLRRRILRRMELRGAADLEGYLAALAAHPGEIEDLHRDLLINVTSFFRDPEVFEALKAHVFPAILRERPPGSPLRIWVPGASTGEEAYSIAIALLEFLDGAEARHEVQIFGTDLSEAALQRARAAVYTSNIALDVSPERLRRFFIRLDGAYQITKAVRDLCAFARHNAATDPPFSRLDLISCRNLMIYFERSLQVKVLEAFHQALNPTGFLALGSSEDVSPLSDRFEVVDPPHKIFRRRLDKVAPGSLRAPEVTVNGARDGSGEDHASGADETLSADWVREEADHLVMSNYAPAGVVIDEEMQILQFRGKTGPYLEPAPGDASLHLLRMAREGLLLDLRATVLKAKKSGVVARKGGIGVRRNGELRRVDVDVWPLKAHLGKPRCFLVVFTASPPGRDDEPHARRGRRAGDEQEVEALRRELATTNAVVQSIIEEQEATNEELKSANEELLSSNEELQSINEQLGATRQELQSANEELSAANAELKSANVNLWRATDDLRNLLNSVGIPIVMLDADLRIRRLTPAAERLLRITPADVGRPIAEIDPGPLGADLEALVAEVVDTMSPLERRVPDAQGRWHVMRIRPYRTLEGRVDGAVLAWFELDVLESAARG